MCAAGLPCPSCVCCPYPCLDGFYIVVVVSGCLDNTPRACEARASAHTVFGQQGSPTVTLREGTTPPITGWDTRIECNTQRDHSRPAPPLGSGPAANAALPAAMMRRPQGTGKPAWSIPPPKGWPPRGAAGWFGHHLRRQRATCPTYIRHHPHRSNPWKTSRGWGARRRCWPGASPLRGG